VELVKTSDEILILRDVEALKLGELPLRHVAVRQESCLSGSPEEEVEEEVEVDFINYFLLEALEDSKIDMRYLKSVKRKYSRLQGATRGAGDVPAVSYARGMALQSPAFALDAERPPAGQL
jgi:hypothetical protein